ncbi:hypothetical protein C8J55DRAFT_493507 [Lentinula edodes]|uniref:Uncharacterized protein n=1 Tax=Lentinula lateritia TaxID=40482 RepID=A0A9W8ZRQ4_9AGAR|nr:hypothetical protein C8J55DRAFT_493507 [Lentinula edodes]
MTNRVGDHLRLLLVGGSGKCHLQHKIKRTFEPDVLVIIVVRSTGREVDDAERELVSASSRRDHISEGGWGQWKKGYESGRGSSKSSSLRLWGMSWAREINV